MTVLSAQSIREAHIVEPFEERSVFMNGTSYGLSSCGYDIRLDLPGDILRFLPGDFHLASSIERFRMPHNVVGFVHDKSTFARMGLAVQNTVIEPGWQGFLTMEITNHSKRTIDLIAGQPIAQIVFHWLDQPTEQPYRGKYQNQAAGPVEAKFERAKALNIDEINSLHGLLADCLYIFGAEPIILNQTLWVAYKDAQVLLGNPGLGGRYEEARLIYNRSVKALEKAIQECQCDEYGKRYRESVYKKHIQQQE